MKNMCLFFPTNGTVPTGLETAVFTLIPLKPEHVQLDYAALMESKPMLRLWSGSPWPQDDFSVENNLEDLEWHWHEHQERIAFTYTVLNPAQNRCLGCVYIKPFAEMVEQTGLKDIQVGDFETAVRFWVTEPALADDDDRILLENLIRWFQTDWPFQRILFHTHEANGRQLDLFAAADLKYLCTLSLPDRGGKHQFWRLGND